MTQVVDRQRWFSGLSPASQRPWWQYMLQSPLFWTTLVLVPFFACNLVDQCQLLNPDRTHPDGMMALGLNSEFLRMAVYWVMRTILMCTMLFIWLDRFHPQKPFAWFLSFGWGTCTAMWASTHINSWVGRMMQITSADADLGIRPAISIVPFTEEATKATVPFLLVAFYRSRFISRVNVISLAGLSAIRSALVEDIIYYARVIVFVTNHTEARGPRQAVFKLMVLQGVYTPPRHPIFTMMMVFGITVTLGACSRWVRVIAPLAGFLLAAGRHMLFNGVSSLNSVDNPKNQRYMALGFVVAVVLFLVTSVVGKTRVLWHCFIDLR